MSTQESSLTVLERYQALKIYLETGEIVVDTIELSRALWDLNDLHNLKMQIEFDLEIGYAITEERRERLLSLVRMYIDLKSSSKAK